MSVSFTFYYLFPNVSYANSSKRPRKEGCIVTMGKRSKAGGRKKRRGQLEAVKMREERGLRMEGRK